MWGPSRGSALQVIVVGSVESRHLHCCYRQPARAPREGGHAFCKRRPPRCFVGDQDVAWTAWWADFWRPSRVGSPRKTMSLGNVSATSGRLGARAAGDHNASANVHRFSVDGHPQRKRLAVNGAEVGVVIQGRWYSPDARPSYYVDTGWQARRPAAGRTPPDLRARPAERDCARLGFGIASSSCAYPSPWCSASCLPAKDRRPTRRRSRRRRRPQRRTPQRVQAARAAAARA